MRRMFAIALVFCFSTSTLVKPQSGGMASATITMNSAKAVTAGVPKSTLETTPKNFKIAFTGDTDVNSDAEAVLSLILNEGADALIHNGDLGYGGTAQNFEDQINAILGADYPYFYSVGNHDHFTWYEPGDYGELGEARMKRLGIVWDGDYGVRSALYYKGIFIVLTAPDIFPANTEDHDIYIRSQLGLDNSIWRISSWHKNQSAMQVFDKSDETGWGVYEESRKGGAIITTGHAHNYSRSYQMSDLDAQVIATTSDTIALSKDLPETAEDEGNTFVHVTGLGGRNIKPQLRDGPWWAKIYSSTQNATFGALFGVFNYDGNQRLAYFYFKNINGEILDEFYVRSTVGGNYSLNAAVSPPGAGTVIFTPTGPIFEAGTTVSVSVSPSAGFQFDHWEGDLTGSANPTTIIIDRDKNVTATFVEQAPAGVVYQEAQTGTALAKTSVSTSSDLTAVAGDLYLAAIVSKPKRPVALSELSIQSIKSKSNWLAVSVSGLGLTWELIKHQCSGRSQTHISIWKAQGQRVVKGAVTAFFQNAPDAVAIVVSRYSGVAAASPIDNVISGNTNGQDGACSRGRDYHSYLFNRPATVGGVMIYAAAAMLDKTHQPGAGFTERIEMMAGSNHNAASVAVLDQSVASAEMVSLAGAFSGKVDWAIVSFEIKPAPSNAPQAKSIGPARTLKEVADLRKGYELQQNYPNPFNPTTTITFHLPTREYVALTVYDMVGRQVARLVDETLAPGQYEIPFNGTRLASGVYFYRFRTSGFTKTVRFRLVK